jgi:hypothetical protein
MIGRRLVSGQHRSEGGGRTIRLMAETVRID